MRYDVKKLLIAKKCLPLALGLAGFVAAGTVPVFAQSSGTWAAGISTRNARPFVHTPSVLDSGCLTTMLLVTFGQLQAVRPSAVKVPKRNRAGISSPYFSMPAARWALFDHEAPNASLSEAWL
jgi:hypothetical protein